MSLTLQPAIARLAFFIAAVAVLVIANLPDPPQLPGELSDKQQHFLAFAVLTLLARPAWPTAAAWELLISLGAFGALIEFAQAGAGYGRDPSLADWLADCLAVVLVLALFFAIRLVIRRGKPAEADPDSQR